MTRQGEKKKKEKKKKKFFFFFVWATFKGFFVGLSEAYELIDVIWCGCVCLLPFFRFERSHSG